MKQILKGYIAGILSVLLFFTAIPTYANDIKNTIEVIFNKVNISVNGTTIGKAGEDYKLENGQYVPYSISYKGTTYLPIRKVAEAFGKDVTWDGNTNTAGIADKLITNTSQPVSNKFSQVDSYNNAKLQQAVFLNDKKYTCQYIGGQPIYKDENNEYYMSFSYIWALLMLTEGNYKINQTMNPYFDGNIEFIDQNSYRDYDRKEVYTNAVDKYSYVEGKIFTKDKTKSVFFSGEKGKEINLINIDDNSGREMMKLSILKDYFNLSFNVKFDYDKRILLLEIKK